LVMLIDTGCNVLFSYWLIHVEDIMQNSIKGLILGALALPAMLISAPMISIDNENYDAGIIHEGEMSSLKHTFKVKNTGDSTLIIKHVKPG